MVDQMSDRQVIDDRVIHIRRALPQTFKMAVLRWGNLTVVESGNSLRVGVLSISFWIIYLISYLIGDFAFFLLFFFNVPHKSSFFICNK